MVVVFPAIPGLEAVGLDPVVAEKLADQAGDASFRRQREQLLLDEHGSPPNSTVMITAAVDPSMRHLVGRTGQVRRCAWRAAVLMCEVVLAPPPPLPQISRNGRVSWPRVRGIDRIPTAIWVPANALQAPPPGFRTQEGMNSAIGVTDSS